MMKKNAIALAVAGLFASPLTVAAAGHWEVMTPSSVSESAPQLLSSSHLPPAPVSANIVATATDVETAPSTGATTSAAVEHSAQPARSEGRRQIAAQRKHTARTGGGMPNPQTPWSPNESGEPNYAQEMQAYRQQVASVEQARIATAESYAPQPAVAQLEPTPVDKEAAAEVDRLLANPSTPPSDREPAAVARVSPALVDSRVPGTSELRVESTTPEQPAPDAAAVGATGASEAVTQSSISPTEAAIQPPAAPPETTIQSSVAPAETAMPGSVAPADTGASTVAAASSSVAGTSATVEAAPIPAPDSAPASAAVSAAAPVGAVAAPERATETQGGASTPAQ